LVKCKFKRKQVAVANSNLSGEILSYRSLQFPLLVDTEQWQTTEIGIRVSEESHFIDVDIAEASVKMGVVSVAGEIISHLSGSSLQSGVQKAVLENRFDTVEWGTMGVDSRDRCRFARNS